MKLFTAIAAVLLGVLGTTHALSCTPDAETLCLADGRFAVSIDWRDAAGNPKTLTDTDRTGTGKAHTLKTDTGTFSLFTDQNHEVMVKVLDGCAFNNHFWVFATATTNVEYTLRVTDTDAGVTQDYFNPLLTDAAPVLDITAFDTCATGTTTTPSPLSATPPIVFEPGDPVGTCVSDADTLCLVSNRFAVRVEWKDFADNTGNGGALPLTNKSGTFYFFHPDNHELLVNIYDGRQVNGSFWYFIGGLTNVAYDVTITDTLAEQTKVYSNPLGTTSPSVLDINAGPDLTQPQGIPLLSVEGVVLLALAMALLAIRRRRLDSRG